MLILCCHPYPPLAVSTSLHPQLLAVSLFKLQSHIFFACKLNKDKLGKALSPTECISHCPTLVAVVLSICSYCQNEDTPLTNNRTVLISTPQLREYK